MAALSCNFEFFIQISQGLLWTATGLVRSCETFENWGNPWQSLESLSCPGKDLSPLECQYGKVAKYCNRIEIVYFCVANDQPYCGNCFSNKKLKTTGMDSVNLCFLTSVEA